MSNLFWSFYIDPGGLGGHPGGSRTHSGAQKHPKMHFSKKIVSMIFYFKDGPMGPMGPIRIRIRMFHIVGERLRTLQRRLSAFRMHTHEKLVTLAWWRLQENKLGKARQDQPHPSRLQPGVVRLSYSRIHWATKSKLLSCTYRVGTSGERKSNNAYIWRGRIV